jgi:hypothetical protein
MPNTYTLIKSETLGSSAASYTFSAIPNTFTDLVVRVVAQSAGSGYDFDNITMTFNGTGTTNQGTIRLTGNGSTSGANVGTNQGIILVNVMPKTIVTGSPWSNVEVYIPSYGVSQSKPLSTFGVSVAKQTTAWISTSAGLFADNTVISSIVLTGSADFVSGSSFYLYGIKNS